jgi:hypothetical protein
MNKYLTVDEFLNDLTEDRRQQVEALRLIIKAINPELSEHIKWNSPSYVLDGEDRITFNMHYPDQTMLLIHMGATRKETKKADPIMNDTTGLIKWNSDIRGTLAFHSLDDIARSEADITKVLSAWLLIK